MRKNMEKIFEKYDRITANRPVDQALVNVIRQREGVVKSNGDYSMLSSFLNEMTDDQVDHVQSRLSERTQQIAHPGKKAVSEKFNIGNSKSIENQKELDWFCDKLTDEQVRAIEPWLEERKIAKDQNLQYQFTRDFSDAASRNTRSFDQTVYVPKENKSKPERIKRRGFFSFFMGFLIEPFSERDR